MDADQLAETTMDRAHRSLRRITLADEEALRQAEDVFELLMGSTVGPRKEFHCRGVRGAGSYAYRRVMTGVSARVLHKRSCVLTICQALV